MKIDRILKWKKWLKRKRSEWLGIRNDGDNDWFWFNLIGFLKTYIWVASIK